jgi:hypothetical protein
MDRMRRSLLQSLVIMPPALWTGSFISSAVAQTRGPGYCSKAATLFVR